MSLKKDIVALVKSNKGEVKINRICKLVRWTKDGLGDEVDKLELQFCRLGGNGVYQTGVEIYGREYTDIEVEVAYEIKKYLEAEAKNMINDLRASYIN